MTAIAIIVLLASLLSAALAYARAWRLHRRILQIDPHCPWTRRHPLTRPPAQKE